MEAIQERDRHILRELAHAQSEYAHSPQMREINRLWYTHNDLQGTRPMIQVELWSFEKEVIPPKLRCESETARRIERDLYANFLNHELFNDDYPVPDFIPVYWRTWFTLFGVTVETEHAENSQGDRLGHRFKYHINDLHEDLSTLKETAYGVDRAGTLAYKAYLEEIFGDILPVRLTGSGLCACPTQDVVHLMGLENMMMAPYDCPDDFHELMKRICDDYAAYHTWLKKENLIPPTDGRNPVGQGTWGFTNELPADTNWGYLDSQESVGMSPDMYGEFIYPYYQKIAKAYGLLSYGCCEPVHAIWETYLSRFSNLRKVSVSPWCDEEYMGEQLHGGKVIFHRKPSPNFVGVGAVLDEEGFAAHINKTVRAARGCPLEFTMRDVYTIHHDPQKVRRAVEIIRAAVEK